MGGEGVSVEVEVVEARVAQGAQGVEEVGDRGLAEAIGLGRGLAVAPVADGPDGPRRRLDPALETAWLQIAATWPGRRGRTFVRFRAIVPVAGDFHPLGYLPWIAVGRVWGAR